MAKSAMICVDEYGFLIDANSEAERILGCLKGEMNNQHFKHMISLETLPVATNAFRSALAGEKVPDFEFTVVQKTGKSIQVKASISPLQKSGKCFGVKGILKPKA